MKKLPLILCLLLGFGTATVYGQLFIQDFSASTTVADYVSASPDNTQFTYAAATGAGVVVTINNGTLQFIKSGSNAGVFNRSANFSPAPGLMKVEFDLEVPSASGSVSNAAIFRFGQSYSDDGSIPDNDFTHSRLGINMVSGGGFQLRNIALGANSATYTGTQTITWWVNNSGVPASYTDPNGTNQTLGNDKNDVWISGDLAFNEMDIVTPNIGLVNFKMIFSLGTGTIRFDNFLITTEASLPVELSRFDSRLIRKQTHLNWATESETDNDYFAVERSADGRQYTEIGRVPGAGTTREPQTYGFVDQYPQKGLNYYRLRQVDLDGRLNFSPVRVVALDEWLDVRLFPSPAAAWLELNWSEPVESVITWQILDPAGRQIESGLLPEAGTRSTLALQQLAPGSYLLRLSDGQRSWSQVFLKN
jgi:hypothetical protein